VALKSTIVKLIKILDNPTKYVGLTKTEISAYMKDRKQLIERVQKEFPSLEIDDSGKSKKNPQTKVRFLDKLTSALNDKRITVPYSYVLESMQFQYDEDDDPDLAAAAEARNATSDAKRAFIEEVEDALDSSNGVKVKSVMFEELDDDDATYKIVVQATESDHKRLLSKICGLSEAEISDVLKESASKQQTIQVPKSVVDDFVSYVIEEQHKLFAESFQADPDSFDNEEPQKMTSTEAAGFITRSLGELNEDVIDMLKSFAKSCNYSPDDVLEAVRVKHRKCT